MRKFLTIILLLVSVMISAQQPQMTFKQQAIDIGHISVKKKKVKCRFVFRNVGDAPLLIDEVETSCGCTSASYKARPVPPGSHGVITIVFRPNTQPPGEFRKAITVYANTPGGYTRLFIKGKIHL